MTTSAASERQSFSPWKSSSPPRRILIIRFHAVGDVAIILPAAAGLRRIYPDLAIDLLTMHPAGDLASATDLFGEVTEEPVPPTPYHRLLLVLRVARKIRGRHYDVILDLQRNWLSRAIRRCGAVKAWGEFDRFSPLPAWQRVRQCMDRTGLRIPETPIPAPMTSAILRRAERLLETNGRDASKRLVAINPAGLWATRNWPVENYVLLCRQWRNREPVQFLFLGTERVKEKAALISREIGNDSINLTGRTTLGDALPLVSLTECMVTEDSGLMHMAWSVGVPLVALFGSSRHDWSAPPGDRVVCLHSGDLDCGACMQRECAYGDTHCLTRYTPEFVLEQSFSLLRPRTSPHRV